MTHQHAKTIRKKLRELAGFAHAIKNKLLQKGQEGY